MSNKSIEENMSRFLIFKKPYKQILSSNIFNEIESLKDYNLNDIYKIVFAKQKNLLESSINQSKPTKEDISNQKRTEKWGAFYLRSPEIYRNICANSGNNIVKLSDIADIRFGLKSGANDFFYLDEKAINEWNIENEFLKPFLYSLKEVNKYAINSSSLNKKIFCCLLSKEDLMSEGKLGALSYIKYGEMNNYHLRPSIIKRNYWYSISNQIDIDFVSNRFIGERFGFPQIKDVLVSDVFFVGKFKGYDPMLSLALLNSSFSYLCAEVFSRKTYGLGVGYLYGSELRGLDVVNPALFDAESTDQIKLLFSKMLDRNIYKINDELKFKDRQDLDSIIMEKLSLTKDQQDSIYSSLIELVETRLIKAKKTVVNV